MTEYFFAPEYSPRRDCFGESNPLGEAVQIYLNEFTDIQPGLYAYGDIYDDIVISVVKAFFVHEDIHIQVANCVDSTGGQEHDSIYQWIQEWMNKP